MDIKKYIKKNKPGWITDKRGVTLLELMVSVLLFSMTMLMATQIFKMIIDGQRDAIAAQNMQESMRYTFERMSKEIRMALRSPVGSCAGDTSNRIYKIDDGGKKLTFLNRKGECVIYRINNSRIEMKKDVNPFQSVTVRKISINDLKFSLLGNDLNNDQLLITIAIDAEANSIGDFKHKMKIQTSISSRHYE